MILGRPPLSVKAQYGYHQPGVASVANLAGSKTLAQFPLDNQPQEARQDINNININYYHNNSNNNEDFNKNNNNQNKNIDPSERAGRKSLTWARGSSVASHIEPPPSQLITLILNGGPKWNFRIRQQNNSNRVIVSRVFKGPAEKAGLRVNDELLKVNNVPLSDTPRSLLLADHPEQQQQLNSTLMQLVGNGGGATGPTTTLDDVPKSASSTGGDPGVEALRGCMPTGGDLGNSQHQHHSQSIELSKLEFAYQLIKHSSASNKLVLTIARQIYNINTKNNSDSSGPSSSPIAQKTTNNNQNNTSSMMYLKGSSSTTTRPCNRQQRTTNNHMDSERPATSQSFFSAPAKAFKTHTVGGVHYAYRCCECYCDNEGK